MYSYFKTSFSDTECVDALILFTIKNPDLPTGKQISPAVREAAPWLVQSRGPDEFVPDLNRVSVLYAPGRNDRVRRVILAGLGDLGSGILESPSKYADAARSAAGAALRACRDVLVSEPAFELENIKNILTSSAGNHDAPPTLCGTLLREAVYGAAIGLYTYSAKKIEPHPGAARSADPLRLIIFGTPSDNDEQQAAEALYEARAVTLARNLINSPSNLVTPTYLAQLSQSIAETHPDAVRCTVLTPDEIRANGMNALLAVSAGSAEEPRFIVLDYAPDGCKNTPPVVLIGKGVTFDSGGICLKPAAGMDAMKDDMSGAAAVLGVFDLLNALKIKRHVTGILPCTENMPSGTATRPGDVIQSMSEKTIEIVNTDAEGRLALCDALTYAQKNLNPRCIIDIATLTGACVSALGPDTAGVFCRDRKLAEKIVETGFEVGEHFWQLPLWDKYFATLKSSVADLKNSGTRKGGAQVAAAFLAQFIERDIPWVHLDIAGPAYTESSDDTRGGARGFGVRTLYRLVSSL